LAIAKNPEGFPEIALIEPTAPIPPLFEIRLFEFS